MIEMTEDLAKAVEGQKAPLHILNPHTNEVFVLVRKKVYDLTCQIVGGPGKAWADDADDDLIRKPA